MPELNELKAQLLAVSEEIVALGERKPKDDDEDEAIISLMEEKEKERAKLDAQVRRLERVQEIKASLAKPLTIEGKAGDFMAGGPQRKPNGNGRSGNGGGYYEVSGEHLRSMPQAWEKPGIWFSRYVKCYIGSRLSGEPAVNLAKAWYPDDGRLDFRAALGQNIGTSGGFLVPEEASREFIEYLRHLSVIRPYARIIPVNGSLTMPVQTGGTAGSYIGENEDDNAQDLQFGQRKFDPKKERGLVVTSNDLIRNSSPEADMIIRDDLAGALAETQDLNFIRGTGVGAGPKGIRYWAAAAAVNNGSGTTSAAIELDLSQMVARMAAGYKLQLGALRWLMPSRTYYKLYTLRHVIGTDPVSLVFPEIRGNPPMLLGWPVSQTNQIPITLGGGTETEIYLVNMSDVMIGDEAGITIAVSDTAAYRDSTGTLQSAFSRDQTVIRAIAKHDLQVRRVEAVQVLTGNNVTY